VVNGPAAAAPSGLERAGGSRGLAGLRERTAACGGDFTAGPAAGGGWQVLARLPAIS
jgi:signal transduction histidine kinase